MNATKEKKAAAPIVYGKSAAAIEARKLAQKVLDNTGWRDPNPNDPENRQRAGRGNPTGDWREAVAEFLAGWTDPIALPYANAAVAELKKAWKRFEENVSDSEYGPTGQDWALLDSVLIAQDDALPRVFADPPTVKPRRTPAQQLRDGASLRTIALELRWHDANGHPDTDRVERELDNPGSEWTPEEIEARRIFDLQQLGFLLPPEEIARLTAE